VAGALREQSNEPAGPRRPGRLSRVLRLLARPVRRAQGGEGGIVLEPYRGYGTRQEVFLIGRAFRQSTADGPEGGLAGELRDIARRLVRRPVREAPVTARMAGAEVATRTDRDGYFRIRLAPRDDLPADRCWHEMEVVLHDPATPDLPVVKAEGEVFVPPPDASFVVISDIDDTVVKTGVANTLAMLWRLFVLDADERTAFPGAAALYRALHRGDDGRDRNPLLYVSRAPWGTYDVLEEFFRLNDIPVGPILFLREWGVSWTWPFPRRAESHKRDLIAHMLEIYRDLPFVLIGDSGQHDPEIYRCVVEENPGRVLAVYIRNVSRDRARLAEIEALAAVVAKAGSSFMLAADSAAIASHAQGLGLMPAAAAETVREASLAEGGRGRSRIRKLARGTARATAKAVERGGLGPLVGRPGTPPRNVLVEPEKREDP
jgi:phosphatidate phosphatase APP1